MLSLIITNLLLLLLIVVVVYDSVWFRIPNVVVGTILILFVVEAVRGMEVMAIVSHFGAGLVMFVIGFILYSFRLFGAGDAKLLAVTGVWAGFEHLSGHVLMFSLLGGVMAILLLVLRQALFVVSMSGWIGQVGGMRVPRLLTVGADIPYGVPIALSLILIRTGYDPLSVAVARALSQLL